MSKGNMLLGHARGKVGSLVFSRSNGQQIVRARAEVVKNPQTESQMIQRILLNTIAQAYSKMSAIVDHSFEGIPAGQKSMSYFMKKNLKNIRQTLADVGDLDAGKPYVSPVGTNVFATNDYEVSRGSLPVINPTAVNADVMKLAVAANTYKAVIDATGLQRGDQLTFLILDESPNGTITFRYRRVILDPKEDDGADAPLTTAFVQDGDIVKPNPKNENVGLPIAFNANAIEVSAVTYLNAGAIIASRQKEDGTWMRSNSTLVICEDGLLDGYSMQQALDMFNAGGIDTINPMFLNNASKKGATTAGGSVAAEYTVTLHKGDYVASVSGAGTYDRGAQVTVVAVSEQDGGQARPFRGWFDNAQGTGAPLSTDRSYSFRARADVELWAIGTSGD